MAYRVGIDTGGTFTDLIALDETGPRLVVAKRPSTPSAPQRAVFDALERSGISPREIAFLILGTTIAINSVHTRAGARVLYVATAGFEDVLFIQRLNRKHHYDLQWIKPEPFCERRDCLGVVERVDKDGKIIIPLTDEALERLGAGLAERLAERDGDRPLAIAVNLLFSYANPVHEERVAEFLARRFPGTPVSISHDVAPIWREYERGLTTVIDAYVKPLVSRFVGEIDRELGRRGVTVPWAIMKSNGGNMLAAAAEDQPVQVLLSGLAGGMIAGKYFGERVGSRNVISLDMGGTSTDVGVVADGEFGFTTEYQVEWGLPVSAPLVDLTTIGAGGGSIAWIDNGGFLKVGPESAGADPGPACYDRGGVEATVTDANLVLGRFDPHYFLGGDLPLNPEKARAAVAVLATRLRLSIENTALSIIALANENMANAIRLVTVERGLDPREFDLVAFGGAGPLHAADLAAAIGIRRIIVPPHPGLGSAFGALLADLRVDRIWTHGYRSTNLDPGRFEERFNALTDSAVRDLREEGFTGEPIVLRSISMRYLGQNYEQDIPVPPGRINAESLHEVMRRFDEQHEQFYGYHIAGETMEFIHFKVSAIGPVAKIDLPSVLPVAAAPRARSTRPVFFEAGGRLDCPVFRRGDLGAGTRLRGPALVEEEHSVTLAHPGQTLEVAGDGMLIIAGIEATADRQGAQAGAFRVRKVTR
jgi:N-methylhydantoinase A